MTEVGASLQTELAHSLGQEEAIHRQVGRIGILTPSRPRIADPLREHGSGVLSAVHQHLREVVVRPIDRDREVDRGGIRLQAHAAQPPRRARLRTRAPPDAPALHLRENTIVRGAIFACRPVRCDPSAAGIAKGAPEQVHSLVRIESALDMGVAQVSDRQYGVFTIV